MFLTDAQIDSVSFSTGEMGSYLENKKMETPEEFYRRHERTVQPLPLWLRILLNTLFISIVLVSTGALAHLVARLVRWGWSIA